MRTDGYSVNSLSPPVFSPQPAAAAKGPPLSNLPLDVLRDAFSSPSPPAFHLEFVALGAFSATVAGVLTAGVGAFFDWSAADVLRVAATTFFGITGAFHAAEWLSYRGARSDHARAVKAFAAERASPEWQGRPTATVAEAYFDARKRAGHP